MQRLVVRRALEVGGYECAWLKGNLDRPLDFRRDAMGVLEGFPFLEQEVDLDAVGITRVPVAEVVVAEATRFCFALKNRD